MMIYPSKSNIDLYKTDFSDVFRVYSKRSQKVKIICFRGDKKEAIVSAEVGHM